jgi:predicted transglutaminase-like cysteine proteinase
MQRPLRRAVRSFPALLMLTGIWALPVLANDINARSPERSPQYMRVYGPAAPPYGFVDFCVRMPAECASGPVESARFFASPQRLAELDDINRVVNNAIEPATDLELYGVEEYWTLPVTRGDCEDYALLKRHLLIKRGWPIGSLLMTVVKDEKGEGHAILTARTAQGDFVLDNKTPNVLPWQRTAYEFVMRQSYLDPRVWMSLDPKQVQPPSALSGVKDKRTSAHAGVR